MEKIRSMSLYDITTEEMRVRDALIESDGELTPEIEAVMETLKDGKVCKVQSYHHIYLEMKAAADAAEEEERRLAAVKRRARRVMETLKDALRFNMESLGISRIEGGTVTAQLRANPPRTVFDEDAVLKPYKAELDRLAALLPDYITIAPVVSRTGLKAALDAGDPVDASVREERSYTVVFK